MNYTDYINAICAMLEYTGAIVDPSSASPTNFVPFNQIIPRAIEYTELRMQRDLDFIATTTTANGTMVANSRTITLPIPSQGAFVVVSEIIPIVAGDKQQPLEPITRSMLDYFWPSELSPGANIVPLQWTPNDQLTAIVGPAPDQNYDFQVVGTTRFPPLSASNTTNFLTQFLPDIYLAASMIFYSGYQRDFGSQSDDPAKAQSWESQYQALLSSAVVEEARKRYADMYPHASDPAPSTG